jgi:hypothetical protein
MSESTEPTGTDTEPTGEDATTEQTAGATDPAARIAALEAEVNKWKGLSRKHEKAAKGTTEPATEAPKASSDEVAALRAEMVLEKAQDKLDAAAAKAGVDVSEILEFVKIEKFIDDGRVDTDAISTFVTKFAANAPKAPKFAQGIGVGQQAGGAPGQLSKADLNTMTDDQITKAIDEGRFDRLLGKLK